MPLSARLPEIGPHLPGCLCKVQLRYLWVEEASGVLTDVMPEADW